MSQLYKARAALACEIAGVHPDRFNEAVAAGAYHCAPQTKQGVARIFTEVDIVGLMIFGILQREEMSTSAAGHIACQVMAKFKDHPEAIFIYEIRGHHGRVFIPDTDYQADATYNGAGIFAVVRRWPVAELQKYVHDEIEPHLNVAG